MCAGCIINNIITIYIYIYMQNHALDIQKTNNWNYFWAKYAENYII